jgi:hypothetical protein
VTHRAPSYLLPLASQQRLGCFNVLKSTVICEATVEPVEEDRRLICGATVVPVEEDRRLLAAP